MDEPILVSNSNSGVVLSNPPGKHKGGDAIIFDPNHQNGILCQFILGRRKVLPQTILREKNIETLAGNEDAT